ncbi:MAG TPA: hypothetical protein VE779_14985, partial [Candidatus Angelobacter sp.]|nr:hypothetical protein [Candidatus Angelobacter sp.]
HAGSALPIYVNLSLRGPEKVAVEVNCGLQRLVRERLLSMRAAARELNNHLRGEVTAILLNAELALREQGLAPMVAEKLHAIHDQAEKMRSTLEDGAMKPTGATRKSSAILRHEALPTAR